MSNLTPLLLNGVSSVVQAGSSAIGSSSATGVNVATGDGANFGTIGTNQYIPAVIVDTSTTPETIKEYVWITARTTDALTVVRQAEEASRFTASTTTIQAGYVIAAVASAVGLYDAPGIQGLRAREHGLLTWNYDLPNIVTASTTISAGALRVMRMPLPGRKTITNILTWVAGAGSGLTANQCLAGLYTSDGATLLGQTGDQSTAWTATGLQTMALTAPVAAGGGGPDAYVFVALLAQGTSRPAFASFTSTLSANLNLATAVSRSSTYGSGLTALPSSLTLASLGQNNVSMWAALS